MACGCSKGKSRTTPRTVAQPRTSDGTRVVRRQASAPREGVNAAPSTGLTYVLTSPDGEEEEFPTLMAAQQARRGAGTSHRISTRRISP